MKHARLPPHEARMATARSPEMARIQQHIDALVAIRETLELAQSIMDGAAGVTLKQHIEMRTMVKSAQRLCKFFDGLQTDYRKAGL